MIFLRLFLEFLKIGLFTFGGGYGMIQLVRETVLRNGWMSESEFINMIGLSEVTPGPIAINMATYVGSLQGSASSLGAFGGFLGSLIATVAVILPAFIVMLIFSIFLKKFGQQKHIKNALKGINPVAIALIMSTALILLSDVLFPINTTDSVSVSFNRTSIFIFLLIAFIYLVITNVLKKKAHPILIICLGALLGLVVNYINLI